MKILHTSDWHLGHMLYNTSQEQAQQNMLDQITNIISNERPDVLIIAGDIYDIQQPSAAAQKMFSDAIVKMHNAYKDITIVCIAGNHDSGSRHEIFYTPWQVLNVHVLGNILKESDLENYIVEVPNKGYIVAIPFASDRSMPEDVFKRMSELVNERNTLNLPVVLTAHLSITNADRRGHDFSDDKQIGTIFCQDISIFGNDYDYVALGHIHKQQALDSNKRVWYSGTPIAVSFDEVYSGNEHGVLMVECKEHTALPVVTPISITNLTPLVNLPYDGCAKCSDVIELLTKYDDNIPSLIRLNVEVDSILPLDYREQVNKIIEKKKCKVININSQRKVNSNNSTSHRALTISELQQLDVVTIVDMYFKSKTMEFDDDIKAMLQEVKTMTN